MTPDRSPGPAYDVRDDYDDEFGADRTPLGRARRQVLVPAVAHMAIGILCIGGVLIGAGAAVLDYLDRPPWGGTLVKLVVLLALCALGFALSVLMIVGGVCLKNLRRRGLALAGAYIVTGLALAGFYAILFFPFGIWALVLLYQPHIREAFRQAADPVDN